MRKSISVDVAIVGAGVAGLMLTRKLSDLGFKVALIEKSSFVADGPSTRNEGWLHRGTYPAASIQDRSSAVQVARRCIYGYEQLRNFAPEAIHDVHVPAYALIRDSGRVKEVVSRWDEAQVLYKAVKKNELHRIEPRVKTQRVSKIFRVNDLSINTLILYRKLLAQSERSGAMILTDTKFTYLSDNQVKIVSADQVSRILQAKVFIYTAGYGIKDIFKSQFGIDVPLRYWKSHLLILPRIIHHSVFYVDPSEAAMMHHGECTIVGMNEDATLCEKADYDLMPEKVSDIQMALARMFKDTDLSAYHPVSCIKVDVDRELCSARSLNVAYDEPIPNHYWLLPGKMTESPFATDYMTQIICHRLGDERVACRPCDTWLQSRVR